VVHGGTAHGACLAVGDRTTANVHSATDMGTNDTLPDGSAAPAPVVYDIDGILNTAATCRHCTRGDHAICYIEVGTRQLLLRADEGPDQYYAHTSPGSSATSCPAIQYFSTSTHRPRSITEAMINQQCAAKGFGPVEPTSTRLRRRYGTTGFTLTEADEVTT